MQSLIKKQNKTPIWSQIVISQFGIHKVSSDHQPRRRRWKSFEEVFVFFAVLNDPQVPKSSQVTGSRLPSPRCHLLALWALNAGHPLTFLLHRSATRDQAPPWQLCQPHPWQLPLPTEGQRVALMSSHVMSQQQPPCSGWGWGDSHPPPRANMLASPWRTGLN